MMFLYRQDRFVRCKASDTESCGATANRRGLSSPAVENKEQHHVGRLGIDFEDAPVALKPNRAMCESRAVERRADLIDVVRLEPYGRESFAVGRDKVGRADARTQANLGIPDRNQRVIAACLAGAGLAAHYHAASIDSFHPA